MSTELLYTADSDQYNFVKSDLARVQADPAITWIVGVLEITEQYRDGIFIIDGQVRYQSFEN
jgi:hypothetical protein